MSSVIFDISMSLDGFLKASNATPEQPLGNGGERLHEWAFGADDCDREVLAGGVEGSGAVMAGRRTYDHSVRWGADSPRPPTQVFVVTHEAPDAVPEGGVYTFVTDGIESALNLTQETAGDKNVAVRGGPDIGRQFIEAGLVDKIGIHLTPVTRSRSRYTGTAQTSATVRGAGRARDPACPRPTRPGPTTLRRP
jgi:dihydrofolate reductase